MFTLIPSMKDIWRRSGEKQNHSVDIIIWSDEHANYYITVTHNKKINSPWDLEDIDALYENGIIKFYKLEGHSFIPLSLRQVRAIVEQLSSFRDFSMDKPIQKWVGRILDYYCDRPQLQGEGGIIEAIIYILVSNTGYTRSFLSAALEKPDYVMTRGVTTRAWSGEPVTLVDLKLLTPNLNFDIEFISKLLAGLRNVLYTTGMIAETGEVSGAIERLSRITGVYVTNAGSIMRGVPAATAVTVYAPAAAYPADAACNGQDRAVVEAVYQQLKQKNELKSLRVRDVIKLVLALVYIIRDVPALVRALLSGRVTFIRAPPADYDFDTVDANQTLIVFSRNTSPKSIAHEIWAVLHYGKKHEDNPIKVECKNPSVSLMAPCALVARLNFVYQVWALHTFGKYKTLQRFVTRKSLTAAGLT